MTHDHDDDRTDDEDNGYVPTHGLGRKLLHLDEDEVERIFREAKT